MTFTDLCCEHSGFYQLWKVRALPELMQSYLCTAMDPILVQAYITRHLPPTSSGLGVCPDQTSTQLPTQFTHLLQPFMDIPPPRLRPAPEAAPDPQTGFFIVCPHKPFQGSFLTPVCLYILVPLSQS